MKACEDEEVEEEEPKTKNKLLHTGHHTQMKGVMTASMEALTKEKRQKMRRNLRTKGWGPPHHTRPLGQPGGRGP